MSSNFSLVASNPNITGSTTNIVYTGLPSGNALDLILGNQFGFDLEIGGASAGKSLAIQISANILDSAGAAALKAAAPWQVESYQAPSGSKPFFTYNLLPPEGGVNFPNGGSITIHLQNLTPSTTGTAQVRAEYQFDQDSSDHLRAVASLSSLNAPDKNLRELVGDSHALRCTVYVNNGGTSNPIMVSTAPVTAADAVQNTVRLNLLFQHAPSLLAASGDGAGLVAKWDPTRPPTFRLFFPYFNAFQTLPAPLDLTDSLKAGDPEYNAITSAWNIQATLNPTDPDITEDAFWQIALDPTAPVPVWHIRPTPANTHLFTAAESAENEPGPFLDLYLQRIVSALPIDASHPETILYLQWTDFPGFNDGLNAVSLQKTILAISSFSVELVRNSRGTSLQMQWETTGDHCLLSGDSTFREPQALGDSTYIRAVTSDQPLQSSYTLTAVGTGATMVSRTVFVRWKMNTAIPAVSAIGMAVVASPDGKMLAIGGKEAGLRFFDPGTLQPLPLKSPSLPEGTTAYAFQFTPDSDWVYLLTGIAEIYGYNPRSEQFTPGSGWAPKPTGWFLYQLELSPDASRVAAVTNHNDFFNSGANQLLVLDSFDLKPAAGSPIPLPGITFGFAVGPKTGRYYIAQNKELFVLDPETFQRVPTDPLPLAGAALLAISAVEDSLFTVSCVGESCSPRTFSFLLSHIDAATLTVRSQQVIGISFYTSFVGNAQYPLASLALSTDSKILFLVGLNAQQLEKRQYESRLSAFDAQTLQELPWSPISFGELLPFDLTMAPDGSRIYVLAAKKLGSGVDNRSISLYAVDPEFG